MAWETHQDDNGRVYYYDPTTRKSTWEIPDELLTPLQLALNRSGWVEYNTDDGLKYWNNETTGESVWEIPAVVKTLEDQIKLERASGGEIAPINAASSPNITSNSSDPTSLSSIPLSSHSKFPSESSVHPDRIDYLRTKIQPVDSIYPFGVFEFRAALARAGLDKPMMVNADTQKDNPTSSTSILNFQVSFASWNDAIKVIIKDPAYWILRDPVDRRKYYDQFIVEKKRNFQNDLQERWNLLYKKLMDLLSTNKYSRKIKYYSTWATFKDELLSDPLFERVVDEFPNNKDLAIKLQRFVFHKRVEELRKQYNIDVQNTKTQELKILNDQFSKLKVNYDSDWTAIYNSLKSSGVLSTKVFNLDDVDILIEYEEYMKKIERNENQKLADGKKLRYRHERKCRQLFVEFLIELREEGKINVNTTWSAIYPLLKDDERYINICGNSGSTPLDLLWDVIEDERRKIKLNRELVVDIISSKRANYPKDFDEFLDLIRSDSRSEQIPKEHLDEVYKSLQELRERHQKPLRRNSSTPDKDRFASSRHFKRLTNDFYDVLRDIQPPILSDDTWSSVKPRLLTLPEYNALEEKDRLDVFEEYMHRLSKRTTHHSPPPPDYGRAPPASESARDRERRLRDIERVLRNEDLRNRPAGRGLDHGPALDY